METDASGRPSEDFHGPRCSLSLIDDDLMDVVSGETRFRPIPTSPGNVHRTNGNVTLLVRGCDVSVNGIRLPSETRSYWTMLLMILCRCPLCCRCHRRCRRLLPTYLFTSNMPFMIS
jgi:hypothetical protein